MYRFIPILFVLFLFGCGQSSSSSSNSSTQKATIEGNVNIPGATKVVLTANNTHRKDIPFTNGYFKGEIDAKSPNHYLLIMGGLRSQLYIKPGANVFVGGSPGNLSFSGDLVQENTYLNEKAYIRDTMPADRLLLDYSPSAFKNRMAITKQILEAHLQNFNKKNKLDKDFLAYANASIDYEVRQVWQDYIVKNQSRLQQIEAEIGTDYKSLMVQLDKAELVINPVFHNNLWRNFQQIQVLAGTETESEIETAKYRMNYLDNNTAPDSEIRSILYYTIFNQLLNFYRGAELPEAMGKFFSNCQDSAQVASISSRYDALKPLMQGKSAQDFTLPDIDGKMISLSQFRGKVVVVNLWATWCQPCIEGFPEWEALKEEYKNEEVEFLTISIDQKKDQWSNYVHDNNNTGYQLFAENSGTTSFKQAYQIRRIPRYMLIDQQGIIIDTDLSKIEKANIDQLLASQ